MIHLTAGATQGTHQCGVCQNPFSTDEYDSRSGRGRPLSSVWFHLSDNATNRAPDLEFRDCVANAVRYPDVSPIKSYAIDREGSYRERFRAWPFSALANSELCHRVAPGIRHPNVDSIKRYAVGQYPYGKRG